jgi:hypothetical protein
MFHHSSISRSGSSKSECARRTWWCTEFVPSVWRNSRDWLAAIHALKSIPRSYKAFTSARTWNQKCKLDSTRFFPVSLNTLDVSTVLRIEKFECVAFNVSGRNDVSRNRQEIGRTSKVCSVPRSGRRSAAVAGKAFLSWFAEAHCTTADYSSAVN